MMMPIGPVTIMKISQSAFLPPEMSWRRKRSLKTVISSQNQITKPRIINIDQSKCKSG